MGKDPEDRDEALETMDERLQRYSRENKNMVNEPMTKEQLSDGLFEFLKFGFPKANKKAHMQMAVVSSLAGDWLQRLIDTRIEERVKPSERKHHG